MMQIKSCWNILCGVIKLVTKPSHSLREDICYNVFPIINVVGLIVHSRTARTVWNVFKYYNTEVPSTLRRGNLKMEASLWKRINCFPFIGRRNLKTQQSQVILDLCFRKTWAGKSHDYLGLIVFEKLRFCDGLVWTVVLTVEIKLRCQISPALLLRSHRGAVWHLLPIKQRITLLCE